MCVRAFVRPMNGNIKESRNRNIDDVSQKMLSWDFFVCVCVCVCECEAYESKYE